MQKNKGGPSETKFADELLVATVTLHKIKEEVYALKTMMKNPGKYLEGSSTDMEIQTSLEQKMDEMDPCLKNLLNSDTSDEQKDISLVNLRKLCDEMSHIVSQPITKAEVFQPDPSKSNYIGVSPFS
jgi:hypothetical protein